MQFISNITFNRDIVFDSERQDHKKRFKVKTTRYKVDNRRKPIYEEGQRSAFARKFEKMTVVEKTFIIFQKELSIDFKPITIIVGDNGTGKSSLMKFLQPPSPIDDLTVSFSNKSREELEQQKMSNYVSNKNVNLTFVKQPDLFIIENQIHKNSFIDRIGKGKVFVPPSDIILKWGMMNNSNGESTIDFMKSLVGVENSVIVLDEPETSLSIKSQLNMCKILKKLSKTNQLIIITHNPIFMNLSKEVYDFETKQYSDTNNYIEAQYK